MPPLAMACCSAPSAASIRDSHPRGFHSGAQRLVGVGRFIGTLRGVVYLCHFCELDFIWNDCCGGRRTPKKASRFAASLSHAWISLGSDPVCAGSHNLSTFD